MNCRGETALKTFYCIWGLFGLDFFFDEQKSVFKEN